MYTSPTNGSFNFFFKAAIVRVLLSSARMISGLVDAVCPIETGVLFGVPIDGTEGLPNARAMSGPVRAETFPVRCA